MPCVILASEIRGFYNICSREHLAQDLRVAITVTADELYCGGVAEDVHSNVDVTVNAFNLPEVGFRYGPL